MSMDVSRIRGYVRRLDLTELFNELGWDRFKDVAEVEAAGRKHRLQGVAQKRSIPVLLLLGPTGEPMLDYTTRLAIERQLRPRYHEHILVFCDASRTTQVWQWVRRRPGRPVVVREHRSEGGQVERIAQMVARLEFELEEEDRLLLPHVAARIATALDVESVTKRFFARFNEEHKAFLSFVNGISAMGDRDWYASLMFNRLMFVYFIQRKRFLDGDPNYLRTRLDSLKARKKSVGFLSFYRYFLRRLFHEGLGRRAPRNRELEELIGIVPYLNGGLFEVHEIEERYPDIDIPDTAFERVFDFFDEYSWHLDERPNRAQNEINPDVIGYIFEKYINQKEMGAYYTREDISGYLTGNSIVPWILESLATKAPQVFGCDGTGWTLVADDADRYISPELRHGMERAVPRRVLDDGDERSHLSMPASPDYGLSGETWHDVLARRQHVAALRSQMQRRLVKTEAVVVSLNLEVLQLLVDMILTAPTPAALRVAYDAVATLRVLDPACGSGAFLFAALAVLQPLHEACLARMEAFLATEIEREDANFFARVLGEARAHKNREYFILKSIVLRSLYGVDIMREAVEICKLRLFLKLAAQVDSVDELEPLPDLDFNIRAGNSLVGFISTDATEGGVLDLNAEMPGLRRAAEAADAAFIRFREMQTEVVGASGSNGSGDGGDVKRVLRRELDALRAKLDRLSAARIGVDVSSAAKLEAFRTSYQPFHWCVEFYGIVKSGGFDVVVGNPPYVELKDVTAYRLRDLVTIPCGDLYACFMERSYSLLRTGGRVALIVPVSAFNVDGFASLQRLTLQHLSHLWVASFSNRPAQLFTGAQKRLATVVGRKRSENDGACEISATRYLRWRKEEREALFSTRVRYAAATHPFRVFPTSLEKLGSPIEYSIFEKLVSGEKLGFSESKSNRWPVYYTRKFGYYLLFLDRAPIVSEIKTGKRMKPTELKELRFESEEAALAALASLSSTTFFWFWNVLSDCRNLNRRDLLAFPLNVDEIPARVRRQLSTLGARYLKALKASASYMQKSGKRLETFEYATCKPIIDKIDEALAKHFGFTDDELTFIVNYDLKYRGGAEDDEQETDSSDAGTVIALEDERVRRQRFRTLLPLFDLAAAAGYLGAGQAVEPQGWVDASNVGKLDDRMFVARIVGRSMEPQIRDGDLAVFRAQPSSASGRIVLAQFRGAADPETGGAYTVKRYLPAKRTGGRGAGSRVVLEPLNKKFHSISIDDEKADEFRIVAEFVRVLAGGGD